MKQSDADKKKLIKELNARIKVLKSQLEKAEVLEGKDAYIEVKVKMNQARFQKVVKRGEEDKALGKFFLQLDITAKQQDVFFPLSVASGKKTVGFMYQIEGTAPASIVTANVEVQGSEVTRVKIGTLLFAKIPTHKTVTFRIQTVISGNFNKKYKLVFGRLNYKLNLTDTRYRQYLKAIHSDEVSFS